MTTKTADHAPAYGAFKSNLKERRLELLERDLKQGAENGIEAAVASIKNARLLPIFRMGAEDVNVRIVNIVNELLDDKKMTAETMSRVEEIVNEGLKYSLLKPEDVKRFIVKARQGVRIMDSAEPAVLMVAVAKAKVIGLEFEDVKTVVIRKIIEFIKEEWISDARGLINVALDVASNERVNEPADKPDFGSKAVADAVLEGIRALATDGAMDLHGAIGIFRELEAPESAADAKRAAKLPHMTDQELTDAIERPRLL